MQYKYNQEDGGQWDVTVSILHRFFVSGVGELAIIHGDGLSSTVVDAHGHGWLLVKSATLTEIDKRSGGDAEGS